MVERAIRVTGLDTASRTAWFGAILAVAVVLVCAAFYAAFAVHAVSFPFGRDYAEGEVWQQAELITGNRAYGDINIYPYVGFEYPPLYYLVALAASVVSPNFLVAGRLVSLAATGLAAASVFVLASSFGRQSLSLAARCLGGVTGAGLILTLQPIETFSTLARVDMLQVSLSLAGMAFAVRALRRPTWLYGAVALFVCAGFTKQTALAAPLAALMVMIIRAPKVAIAAYGAGALLAGLLAAGLEWRTGGGFLRHIVVYNVNRYSFLHFLAFLIYVGAQVLPLLVLTALSVWLYWRAFARRGESILPTGRAGEGPAQLALLSLYLLMATVATLLAGKAGSSVNYFLEFLCCCCVWAGALAALSLASFAPRPGRTPLSRWTIPILVPAAIVLQCLPEPSFLTATANAELGAEALARQTALLARLKVMDKPVLSDDMAIVMQAGKTPPVEPYIFAELAAAGLWDEQKLVSLLNSHAFSAVLTFKGPGNIVFDDRYQPRTIDAILANYPTVVNYGDNRLRLPK